MKIPGPAARGFTVLELLVVIAIIALLSSVILVSLTGMQEKARDTRRIEDVDQLQKALGLYLISHGRYPIQIEETDLTGTDPVSVALISEGHISAAPQDPSAPAFTYTYRSTSSGGEYWIGFCLETDKIPNHAQGCGNLRTP